MVHRGDSCGEEGRFGHPQFTEESPHLQASRTVVIGTEGPLGPKIVRFPPKSLALARSHPLAGRQGVNPHAPARVSNKLVRVAAFAALLAGCAPTSPTTVTPEDEPVAAHGRPVDGPGNLSSRLGRREPADHRPAGSAPRFSPRLDSTLHNCHGPDGLGRPEGGQEPSTITWRTLVSTIETTDTGKRTRPAYTEGLLRRAITMGFDPSGRVLNAGMPRYQLTHEDLDDLIAYLKVIESDLDPGLIDSAIRLGVILAPRSQSECWTPVRQTLEAFFEGDKSGEDTGASS